MVKDKEECSGELCGGRNIIEGITLERDVSCCRVLQCVHNEN